MTLTCRSRSKKKCSSLSVKLDIILNINIIKKPTQLMLFLDHLRAPSVPPLAQCCCLCLFRCGQ